jgi:hypothetical protein
LKCVIEVTGRFYMVLHNHLYSYATRLMDHRPPQGGQKPQMDCGATSFSPPPQSSTHKVRLREAGTFLDISNDRNMLNEMEVVFNVI